MNIKFIVQSSFSDNREISYRMESGHRHKCHISWSYWVFFAKIVTALTTKCEIKKFTRAIENLWLEFRRGVIYCRIFYIDNSLKSVIHLKDEFVIFQYAITHSSMAQEPFVGFWPLLDFRCPIHSRSQWSRSIRHEPSSLAQTLGSWARIPLKAWMSVLCGLFCLCSSVCR
jgi:hypothetical protein